ncbi:DUF6127 family protein [Sphingomonas sp. KR1UV-12]|uniref:DUF6127 family protein n=1 Tax=Sphingomonas aurea TaxID=3063994 RepID=A0ABT9ELX7_9SPHN|nr:DUF6127 family protein [Sphingomonas sp. KR1UV-12]MDP1027793.1 DUF6127 family protein [Sphingomonas sp. KR1UV-12]
MSGEVLAQLMAAGVREGAALVTLRAIAEEAGELGASRAMTRLGLADERAQADLAELRDLLGAWRDAKTSAWKALGKAGVQWVVRAAAAGLLALLAVRLGLEDLLR